MFDIGDAIYNDATSARELLEALRWPLGPECPRCGETERVKRLEGHSTRPGVVLCNTCRKPFTVTIGSIFENSKIPLNKWLLAFRLMCGRKRGVSARHLHQSLDITYKSAWFMTLRVKAALDGGAVPSVHRLDDDMSVVRRADRTSNQAAARRNALIE